MSKTLIASSLIAFVLFLAVPLFFVLSNATQTIAISNDKVEYNLPYPGILPDNPLYGFKALRDRFVELTTRDHMKKANLYLLYSDKRAGAAVMLAQKGKSQLAATTFAKGEKYFAQIPGILKTSKSQGVGATSEFIQQLKLSNAKHHELLDQLLADVPQGDRGGLQEVMDLNNKIAKDLNTLK
jgi:hypothetical protein